MKVEQHLKSTFYTHRHMSCLNQITYAGLGGKNVFFLPHFCSDSHTQYAPELINANADRSRSTGEKSTRGSHTWKIKSQLPIYVPHECIRVHLHYVDYLSTPVSRTSATPSSLYSSSLRRLTISVLPDQSTDAKKMKCCAVLFG